MNGITDFLLAFAVISFIPCIPVKILSVSYQ